MTTPEAKGDWRVTRVKNRFLWTSEAIRPADIRSKLREVMLARENLIEDARYRKVVPNRFMVELSPANYAQHYQPIEARLLAQWREQLLEDLETANSRQGRKEYSFSGRVELLIRPAADLGPDEARIYSGFDRPPAADAPEAGGPLRACLELVPGGRRWRLHAGTVTLGRDPENDVALDAPEVHTRRLVSGVHATVRCQAGEVRLFDGAPGGKPSTNGTFLNGQPVPAGGAVLKEGDMILLAAANPRQPRPEAPGTVTLRFRLECPE